MDTAEDLKNWFVKMGYTGKLPKDLTHICNASSAPLWKQVMEVVKPREEVKRIRNNILIDDCKKLSEVTVEDANSEHQMKEIRVWEHKKKLEKQLAFVKEQIESTESKMNKLEDGNKIKYMLTDKLRKEIQQHRQYTFLLKAKSEDLEKQICGVKEKLAIATSLMPIESDDENQTDALDTLKGCTEKLEIIVRSDPGQSASCSSVNDSLGLLDSFDVDNLSSSSPCVDKKNDLYNNLINADKELTISPMLQDLLYQYSRRFIFNSLHEVNELDKNALMNVITATDDHKNYAEEETPLTLLYAKHADYEVKTLMLKSSVKNLEQELESLRGAIFNELSENYPSCSSDLKQAIELKLKEVGLLAESRYLKEATSSMQGETDTKRDLIAIETEVLQLDEEIVGKSESLRQKCDVLEKLRDNIKEMCGDSSMQVAKLKRFLNGIDCFEPLGHGLTLAEINTFLKYPLGYKKVRGLQDIVFGEKVNSETWSLLVMLLTSPWSPPEVLLMNMVRAKQKLIAFKSLKNDNAKKYTFEELRHQDSYVDYAMDKIKSMIYSNDDVEQKLRMVRKCIDLWMEMPLKNFVSPKLLFNCCNYQHYENSYDAYYKKPF